MRKATERPQWNQAFGARGREIEQDRDDDHQGSDLLELGAEIGVGALAHGLGDLLHLLGALVGFTDLTDQHEGVQKASDRDREHDEERDRSTEVKADAGSRKAKGLKAVSPVVGAIEACAPRKATKTVRPRRTTRDTVRLRRLARLRPTLRDPII